ncbi:hypothetical protein GCM10027275_40130 [Rhabdobacter roseus]
MTCVVLLTSTGVGLVEHHCMMRGKSTQFVTIGKGDSCKHCVSKSQVAASASQQPTLQKAACCKDDQSYQKVDVVSSFSQLLAKLLKAFAEAVFAAVKAVVLTLVGWLLPASGSSSVAVSFSSLLHGRSMLSFVQSFLI